MVGGHDGGADGDDPEADGEDSSAAAAGQYRWGDRLSPERWLPWLDPDTYPLPPIGEDPREYSSRVPVETDTTYPIEPDRVLAAGLLAVFFGVVVATLATLASGSVPSPVWTAVRAGIWIIVGLYAVTAAMWLGNVLVGRRSDVPPLRHGADAVQVRILTIDAAGTVQRTVDHLPPELADRHVIAETPMDIDGAEVHVVPDDFECVASNKGRALEWARRTIPCAAEYVLYLDEDTLVTDFEGLPDADVVQFREWPMKTDSWWAYWAEVLRMGYQLEQAGYADLDVPLYSWGGGLAVRKSVEDEITWDFDTLIEDTVFTWFAVENGASFEVVPTRFRNQAPLSLRAMCEQRRRWLVGSIRDEEYLPLGYQLSLTVRNVIWAFSPAVVVASAVLPLASGAIPLSLPLRAATWALLGLTLVWVLGGVRYYGWKAQTLPAVLAAPAVILVHSLGAAWGLVAPPRTFHATEKTTDADAGE